MRDPGDDDLLKALLARLPEGTTVDCDGKLRSRGRAFARVEVVDDWPKGERKFRVIDGASGESRMAPLDLAAELLVERLQRFEESGRLLDARATPVRGALDPRRRDDFFRFARGREQVRVNKEDLRLPRPWTDDPVLDGCKFCNVFREDDRTTRWFEKNARGPLAGDRERSIVAAVAFRLFNLPKTWEALRDLLTGEWSSEEAAEILRRLPSPHRSNAYQTVYKDDGALRVIDRVWRDRARLADGMHGATLRGAHATLMEYDRFGPFMAYQVVMDLRPTLLSTATDGMTWACLGPGSAHGLARVCGEKRPLNYKKARDREAALPPMQRLLEFSRDRELWPPPFRPWEMREVEHALCEYDRYEGIRLEEKKQRRRYDPSEAARREDEVRRAARLRDEARPAAGLAYGAPPAGGSPSTDSQN